MRRHADTVPFSRAALWARRSAFFAFALAALGILLARTHAVDPVGALGVLALSEGLAAIALGLAALAGAVIWRSGRRGAGSAFVGFVLSAAILAPLAYAAILALTLPPVRDLSTDLDRPPGFMPSSKAFAARGGPAPAAMTPEAVGAAKAAYPELRPILVKSDAATAFALATQVAKDLGWKVIDAAPPSERGGGVATVDALDASLLLHIEDEIVIRLTPAEGATIIDLRSVSKLGRHDFGANAKRIAAFAKAVKEAAPTR